MLLEEGVDETRDEVLVPARKGADLFEGALKLGIGRCASNSLLEQKIFDTNAQGASQGREHIGAGWLGTPFPEGDVCVGDPQRLGQLDLGEAGSSSQSEEAGALSWARTLGGCC